jgi:hypothetical protein
MCGSAACLAIHSFMLLFLYQANVDSIGINPDLSMFVASALCRTRSSLLPLALPVSGGNFRGCGLEERELQHFNEVNMSRRCSIHGVTVLYRISDESLTEVMLGTAGDSIRKFPRYDCSGCATLDIHFPVLEHFSTHRTWSEIFPSNTSMHP